MRVYTYSVARQRLSEVLDIARTEEVIIKRRGGENFSIILKKHQSHPLMSAESRPEPLQMIFLMQ